MILSYTGPGKLVGCHDLLVGFILQTKLCELDQRLNSISNERKSLNEKIMVLNTKAEKVNPRRQYSITQAVRLVHPTLLHCSLP